MKGKVKCTCGWSWNKSDSSKKDMYICHECGRDNSNNMKNGGWLENYNDSQASAPEGMVGDGFSNVGRNYSPAWGGQFQEGGEIPMAQNGDKATRADSLAVLNSQLALNKFYDKEVKAGRLKKDKFPFPQTISKDEIKDLNEQNLKFYRKTIKDREVRRKGVFDEAYKRIFNLTPEQVKKLEYQGLGISKSNTNNKAYYRDIITPMQNLQAPFALIDSRIKAQGTVDYDPNRSYPGGAVTVYDYDPLAVTPFDILLKNNPELIPERIKKYGTDGIPKSYLNKIKSTTTKETTKPKSNYWTSKDVSADAWEKFIKQHPGAIGMDPDNVDKDGYHLPIYADKQRPKVEALQPLAPQPVTSDFLIDAKLPVIRPDARMPKSFDVNSQRQTMSGPSEYYNYSDEEADFSDALRAKESADAYNQYIQEKYKEAAKTNPKAQKRLEQLMQNVELTPNYQMGGNVYPVNYVPQAQNGKNKKKKGVQDLLRDVENSVNKSLGNPMQKAAAAAKKLAGKWYNPETKQWEENDPVDNFRHPMAGRYTSEAIQDKLYNIPILSQMAGMTGSNALGVAHELSTLFHPKDKRGWYDKIRESGEDIFNNAVGATVGSLPISDERKTNILTKLSNQNMLPDGVSGKGGDMYIKHAMGGSIPGSVGFTYARTNDPAPSEGPYAKKTMASAQNGKEMQYYQEGLDWKPKTISKNGGWLDGYDEAQEGKRVLPNNRALQILGDVQKRKQKGILSPEFSNIKIKDERALATKPVVSTAVKKRDFDLEQSKENKAYNSAVVAQNKEAARRAKLTKEQREREDYNAYAEQYGTITQSVPETTWERTKAIVSNPMTAIGYKVRGENLPGRFQYGPRNEHDYAVDWINPLQGLAALSEIPGELGRGEFLEAGLSALDAADLGIMAKGLKKVGSNQLRNLSPAIGYRDGGEIEEYPEAQLGALIKKGIKAVGNDAKLVKKAIKTSAKDYGNLLKDLPKAKSVREAVGRVAGLPIEGTLPRLSPEELKIFRQVQEIGRMRATGKPISKQYKYALEQGLPEEHLKKAFGKTKAEIENAISNAQEQEAFRLANPIRDRINLQRPPRTTSSSDAAIDQMNSAAPIGSDQDIQNVRAMFDHLNTQPIISEPPILRGLSTQDLGYSIPPSGQFSKSQNFVEQAIAPIRNTSNAASNRLMNMVQDYPYHIGPIQQNVPSLSLRSSGSLKQVSDEVATKGTRSIQSGDVYTGSLNTSHSSYLPQLKQVFKSTEGAPQFFGYRPMNTMGFLSDFNYSSDDIAKYLNTEIDEQIRRGIIPNNIQRPYVKGNDVFLPHYGIKQFREGGIIDSDRGQWDYPGEITRINSNEITMGPDPKTGKPLTKPLLGISDTGDVKLMRPGGNYKFDGKRVTEYPIAQSGLTMGTTSTENDVRESSAQSAKANTKAKKEAKLLAAKLLAEQEENRRNLFARDIKVRQPDGTIVIVNTGSPEYEEMYKAGEIQSVDAGEGDSPYFGGQLPELVLQQEMTPLLQAKKDYGYLSNKEAFINRKKDEYLKSLGTKNNWFGANRADFPERVLRAIVGQYEYEKNNYAAEQLAKQRGFNLDDRGDWVDELTPAERQSISNSEYSGQLNPNEFAEMASGVQQLANTMTPGKIWNLKIPGLTSKELEEDRESPLSALKVFAPANIPGNLVANYLKNSEDYVDNPFLGTQRMGNVDVWDSMALNPLNLSMITAGSNAVSKIPAAGRAIARGTKSVIENAPAAMNFAADAVKDVRGVVKQYKEISKIKNQDDYYNSVVNTSKYIDDLPKTGIGASGGVTDSNELYDLMTTLSGNFKSYLKRMGGEEFAKTEADKWKQSFVNTDLAKRMEDAIDNNLPLSPQEYKQLAIEFSNSFPKGKSLIAPAKKELAKIQKNIIFNKEKDYETLKEFAKNLKIKIPKRPDKVEYSPKERETIDAIRELGKYKSVANYRKDKLLSDPEAMANINKLILKLDDDVIENILKITKSELLNRYKNIVPDLKKTQVDITSNPIPTADLSLVNEQNLLQPGGVDDLHILNEKQLLAPELKHQTLTDRIGQSYARNFEPVNYEKPSSYPQDLIFMAKTDYQYRNAKDAAGNYLFDAYNNPIEKLVPEGNVKQLLLGAVKKVKASPKGTNFVGSSSLSSDSYPLTLDAGIMMSEKGLVDVGVDTGTMYLNDMGYTHSSPGLVIKDINSKIEQLEKLSGKKLPRAKFDPKADKYRMYKVPRIYFTRLKQGGSINKADENSLVKLDQLTNFTNYNKPQPGGWLNKYE